MEFFPWVQFSCICCLPFGRWVPWTRTCWSHSSTARKGLLDLQLCVQQSQNQSQPVTFVAYRRWYGRWSTSWWNLSPLYTGSLTAKLGWDAHLSNNHSAFLLSQPPKVAHSLSWWIYRCWPSSIGNQIRKPIHLPILGQLVPSHGRCLDSWVSTGLLLLLWAWQELPPFCTLRMSRVGGSFGCAWPYSYSFQNRRRPLLSRFSLAWVRWSSQNQWF